MKSGKWKYLLFVLPLLLITGCFNDNDKESLEQGQSAFKSKNYEEAIQYFKQAIEEEKDTGALEFLETAQNIQKAEMNVEEGNYEQAIRLCDTVISANIEEAVTEDADQLKQKAISLKNEREDVTAKIHKAEVLMKEESYQDAQTILQEVVELTKDKESLNKQYELTNTLLTLVQKDINENGNSSSSNMEEESSQLDQPDPFTYNTYTNTRYGFSVDYPATFMQEPPPTNNDGRVFYNEESTIRASGIHINIIQDNETIETYYNQAIENATGPIAYQSVGSDWYVISYTDGSETVYQKGIIGETIISTLIITYPTDKQDYYEPMVTRISSTFKGGQTELAW